MDCQMPELNGYETTRLIRSGAHKEINPRIPIIALTAYAMSGDADKCRAAGMNDYVSKPLRAADIRSALTRCGFALPLVSKTAVASSLPATSPIADYQHISEMQALPGRNGKSLWVELLDSFRDKSRERIEQIENLVRQKGYKDLAETSHRFAGSCASVGATEIKELALQIEHFAETRNEARLGVCIAELSIALERFLTLMNSRPQIG
jgi:HPt (histidine-containing phosphotransfer) domain-containing protein